MAEQLNKAQKSAISSLMNEDRWNVIELVKELLLGKFKQDNVGGQDAYTELKNLHIQQGKIEGLEQFFEILENQGFK